MARRALALAAAAPIVLALTSPSLARLDDQRLARTFTVTAIVDPAEIIVGESATISGAVEPVRTETKVRIQKKRPSGWVTVAKTAMDQAGSYEYALSPTKLGTHHYRARMPRVGTIAADASPRRTLTVIADPMIVTFTIPPGTDAGSWNTSETPVLAEVGQTLRIVNGDSVPHRLHADGEPFGHPAEDLPPGQTAEYELVSSFTGGSLYCHLHGSASRFWITVTEPPA